MAEDQNTGVVGEEKPARPVIMMQSSPEDAALRKGACSFGRFCMFAGKGEEGSSGGACLFHEKIRRFITDDDVQTCMESACAVVRKYPVPALLIAGGVLYLAARRLLR